MASSMTPLVGCMSLMLRVSTCTSLPPTMTPLSPDIQVIRKPKNSLNTSIIGLDCPPTYTPMFPVVISVLSSKEAMGSLLEPLSHFSQAQCHGWTSVWTLSLIFPYPMDLTLFSPSSITSQRRRSSSCATRLPWLWTLLSSTFSMSGKIMDFHGLSSMTMACSSFHRS